jgi:hypothetical protein
MDLAGFAFTFGWLSAIYFLSSWLGFRDRRKMSPQDLDWLERDRGGTDIYAEWARTIVVYPQRYLWAGWVFAFVGGLFLAWDLLT